MTIDWRTTAKDPLTAWIAAAEDEESGESELHIELGRGILGDLTTAGARYDRRFPPPPEPDKPTTWAESAEHIAWRTVDMPAVLAALDVIALEIDGGAATVIDDTSAETLEAARAAIVARLEAIASGGTATEAEAALAERTVARATLPEEPAFYVAAHYAYVQTLTMRGRMPRLGMSDELLVELGVARYADDLTYGTAGAAELALEQAMAEVAVFLDVVTP